VLYRNIRMNTAFGDLDHANGSANGHGNLSELLAFFRGPQNGAHDAISSPTHTIAWSLDAVGNFANTSVLGRVHCSNPRDPIGVRRATSHTGAIFDCTPPPGAGLFQ
jgi:hypothetical protein